VYHRQGLDRTIIASKLGITLGEVDLIVSLGERATEKRAAMDSNKLLATFFSDSEAFIERLNAFFLQLEREPENRELIEQAFRWAHSLKSESSYMDYDGLTRTAGQLESELESLRQGSKTVTPSGLDHLFSLLDECQQRLEQVKRGTESAPTNSGGASSPSASSRGSWKKSLPGLRNPCFVRPGAGRAALPGHL
jgi:HPt (histidine-containing phosphotransfer) domain-containing protein